jgi:hypothetical protein
MAGILDSLKGLGDIGGAASSAKADLDHVDHNIQQIATSVGNAERYIKFGMFGGLALGAIGVALALGRRR